MHRKLEPAGRRGSGYPNCTAVVYSFRIRNCRESRVTHIVTPIGSRVMGTSQVCISLEKKVRFLEESLGFH